MALLSCTRHRRVALTLALLVPAAPLAGQQRPADTLSLDRALNYAFPSHLVAAAHGGRIAWTVDDGGRRNIWTADAPD